MGSVGMDGEGNEVSEDDSPGGLPPAFCYRWWRSLPEFDVGGRAGGSLFPTTAAEVSSLSPRLRVVKEMERLAMAAHDSLDDLRHKLLSYRVGDLWVPAGGVHRDSLDLPPVITILLAGPAAAGKSSLVNLMYSVLGRSGLIPFVRTSSEKTRGTSCLEEHNVLRSTRNGFCVYDSGGLDQDQTAELSRWIDDGVRHLQPCGGAAVDTQLRVSPPPPRFTKRKVNAVMVVADMAEVFRAQKSGDSSPLEAVKAVFGGAAAAEHQSPIVALTHGDLLAAEDRIQARMMICKALGVSESTGAYDIACLNEYGLLVEEFDAVTAYALAEAVYRALLAADRSHRPKPRPAEWLLHAVTWFMWLLSAVFAFISDCFSSLAGRHRGKLKIG
ncbi:P-loop containing nucleoside triphosphate hydrolases superfamily protein [Wolffia australiana]